MILIMLPLLRNMSLHFSIQTKMFHIVRKKNILKVKQNRIPNPTLPPKPNPYPMQNLNGGNGD